MVYYKDIMTFIYGRSLSEVAGSVSEIHLKMGVGEAGKESWMSLFNPTDGSS